MGTVVPVSLSRAASREQLAKKDERRQRRREVGGRKNQGKNITCVIEKEEGRGENPRRDEFFSGEAFFDLVGLFLLINSRSLFETTKKRHRGDLELSETALINWRVRY